MKTKFKHPVSKIVTDLGAVDAGLSPAQMAQRLELEMLAILRATNEEFGQDSDIYDLRDRARVVLATLEQLGLV